ncbi:MAG: hypothetical protein WBG92_15590 [Thiohalocapsa sp.]
MTGVLRCDSRTLPWLVPYYAGMVTISRLGNYHGCRLVLGGLDRVVIGRLCVLVFDGSVCLPWPDAEASADIDRTLVESPGEDG